MDIAEQYFSLPPGTRLEEYEIVSVLGHGSFGLTYVAEDTNLGTRVAIKEYLPGDCAFRDSTRTVRPRSASLSDTLERGKEAFLKEARTLALVSHPNIVKVRRFFRAFGTAYIAMDLIGGRSLADILDHDFPEGGYPDALLKRLMIAVLEGLGALHRTGIIHRDLKPGNILIELEGNPILVDFGAARNFQRSLQRAMTVIMTPGYAPIEQYSDGDRQGPWTDIYAVGAVAYRAIAGHPPEEPYKRLSRSAFVPASSAGAGRYPAVLLSAVDWALAVQPQDRPQTVSALLTVLRTGADAGEATRIVHRNPPEEATRLIAPAGPPISPPRAEEPLLVQASVPEGRAAVAPPLSAGTEKRTIVAGSGQPGVGRGNRLGRIALPIGLAALLVGGAAAVYLFVLQPAPETAEEAVRAEAVAGERERTTAAAEAARRAAAQAEAERQAAAKTEADRAPATKADENRSTAASDARPENAAPSALPAPSAVAKPAPEGAPPAGATATAEPSVAVGSEASAETDRAAAEQKPPPERQAANANGIRPEPNARRTSGIAKVMGLSLANLTPELSQHYGLAEDSAGVVVIGVEVKSQAAEKGVRAGDVIVEVVDAATRSHVRDPADLAAALEAARKSGDKALQLLIGRQGDLRLVALKLDHGPARLVDPRCTSIVESAQLGGALSNEDRSYLRDHCR